jgi:hypothetical protein
MSTATPINDLLPSWRRSIAAEVKAACTIESYIEGATLLARCGTGW